jgi:hypothetical protein
MSEASPHRLKQRSLGRSVARVATEVLAVGLVALDWLATQRAAAAMNYAPFLSGRIVAHVYQPFAWLWWEHRWANSGLRYGSHMVSLALLWRSCEHLVLYPIVVLGGVAALAILFSKESEPPADLHGSAGWADERQIKKGGLL